MANTDVDPMMQPPEGGGGGPGGPQGPPAGGGPILAALARRRQGPQPSMPGPGNQADSMNLLLQAINMIQQAALGLAAGSPLHRDALKAATSLSRHLPQGAPTAGVQQTNVKDLLRRLVQGSFLQKIQANQQPQPGGQNNPAGQAPAMDQDQGAPMPSTPLPGA